ncbi:MAG: MFS transporter, partial [Planctomycetota bacterium]|nr:MFS transporter [Planctomycetota bacterium]
MIKPQIIRWSGLHYGWVVLLIAMICQIFTAPGQTVGVSEFKDLYAHQLQASPRTVAIYYCYGTALGSFALPLFGFLIDRIGCRSSLIVISSLLAITCFLSGWVTNVWGMLLAFTFLRMLAQGALSLVASTMVALWFKRKLAIAYSVMSVGSGFGMMFVPYVFKPLFQTFELAVGFQIIALGICLLIPLAIFLVVDRPSLIGLSQDGDPIPRENQEPSANEKSHWINPDDFTFWEAISTRSFWIVTASQSAWALIGTGLVFNRKSIFT